MIGELSVVTAPVGEPVSLAEAKVHLRVDGGDEDSLISGLIVTAREYCEPIARRAFLTQTLLMAFPAWPTSDDQNAFTLLRPPLVSVTHVKYYDTAGVLQTMSAGDYLVDTLSTPGRVLLGYNKAWPVADLQPGLPIRVQYVAGYGAAGAVPQRYKQAMLLLVGHWYENREQVVVAPGATSATLRLAVESLLTLGRGKY